MSEASIARAFLEASDAAAALAARARRRADAPAVGASDGSPGAVSASMDAEVDAYVARVKAHAKLKACVDAMTHAQRWEDANEALEALEIDLARRIESTIEALARGTRELEDALVDAKATPDVFADFTPRGAVERGRRGREIWNENILAATREPRDENSDEAIEAASDDAIEALGGDENDGMERELTHDEAVEYEPSPGLGRRLSAEDAARQIQAVFRGFRSRSRTNIEARRELEHLGMIASAKHSNRKFNDFGEFKRRSELRSRSAKQLADLEANIRRDLLSSRSESIKDEIKAAREAQALDVAITDDNVNDSAITSSDEDVSTRLCRAVEKYRRRWADCSQVSLNAFDIDHVRSSVLQEVTNALRAEIEDEARALEAQNKKTKVGNKKKGSAEAPAVKKSSSTKKSKAAPSKKSKGAVKQQRQRGMETIDTDLLKTLARLQMVEKTPLDGRLDDYLGTGGERRKGHEDSTMLEVAQLRHVLAVSVVIPLTSRRVHELAPHMKCVLLEGLAANGKSYLARLCAAESGCALFNLSPDRLARAEASGENPKSLMKHVFQAAKTIAPSVIFIRDVDAYFPEKSKKPKATDAECARKLRKDLMKEIKALKPGSRVTVVCTRTIVNNAASSSDPKGFDKMFNLRLEAPPPDYGGRRRILAKALEAISVDPIDPTRRRTGDDASATLACYATAGMTTGALFALVQNARDDVRSSRDPWRALLRRVEESNAASKD